MNIVKTSTKPISMYINSPFFEQLCCYVTSGDFASRMDNINLVSISLQNFPYCIHFLLNLAYKLQILLILQNCCGDGKHKLELCKKKKHLPVPVYNCASVQQTVKTYPKTACIFKYWNGLAAFSSLQS